MKTLYFDFAASSPVDKRVFRVMRPYFENIFASPGAVHSCGQKAMAAVDEARGKIAKTIGAQFGEIIFTGSATEANNLALRGAVGAYLRKSAAEPKDFIRANHQPRLIISAIEHDSVLETTRSLAQENKIELVIIPASRQGFVNLNQLKSSLNNRTILVSIIFAQNEIGSIQPIAEVSKIVKNFRDSKLPAAYPLVHTDAVQAFQFLDCDVNELGVDLMTLSGHKIYGPKGAGALYVNSKLQAPNDKQIENSNDKNSKTWDLEFGTWDLPKLIKPILAGGGQEFGLRSGTENVPAIVGLAKAVELADACRLKESARIYRLRYLFWHELKKIFPKLRLNGPLKIKNGDSFSSGFLPSILNVSFPGYLNEDLILRFDLAGISVSSGSACASRSTKPSPVLKAIGLSEKIIQSSLRFSFGRTLTEVDIKEALRRLAKIFAD